MILLLFHIAHVASLSTAVAAFLSSTPAIPTTTASISCSTPESRHRHYLTHPSSHLSIRQKRGLNRNYHLSDFITVSYSSVSLPYGDGVATVPCCFQFRRKSGVKGSEDILYTREVGLSSSTCDKKRQNMVPVLLQSSRSLPHPTSTSYTSEHDECNDTTSSESLDMDHGDNDDLATSLTKPYTTSSVASIPKSSSSIKPVKSKFEYHHYNDALLNRIISGRQSKSLRWRKRTRRAASTLGLVGITSPSSPGYGGDDTTPQEEEKNLRDEEKLDRIYSIITNRPVPPLSSIVSEYTTNFCTKNMDNDDDDDRKNGNEVSGKNTNKNKLRASKNKRRRFFKRQKPKTPEQYENTKLEWASRYTSLSTLRNTFGTNRNKFWGDFDSKTTRRLYHTLLPRALLGLYEMGLWSPNDLAPLAYEARLAAKKYARERSHVPGRVLSMVYDGFRSWRDWGTWSVEGLSWDQIWIKYEQEILSELEEEEGWGNGICIVDPDQDELLKEEITGQICLRILERSCITNGAIDNMLLNRGDDQFMDESNEKTDDDGLSSSNTINDGSRIRRGRRRKEVRRKWRRRNAERDISRIAAQLERDMEELLESGGDQQLISWIP